MSEYFEIAYAAASKRLCFFTGTGFSKSVTGNSAPSWQELLELVCNSTADPVSLKQALFPVSGTNPLSLEEAAQVIALELVKVDKSIHFEISEIIKSLVLVGNNSIISNFMSNNYVDVVTTNYDLLLEGLSGNGWQSLAPGLPVPRSDARVRIYHVHGSVVSPGNMVVTSEDYFRFLNSESYFSRKLSTVLHENTVVILGYSLGDTNLKAIINEYKGFSKAHVISSNIFLVSRSAVSQYVKDYYYHCYGIRVLDSLQVHDFFFRLNLYMPVAARCTQPSLENIRKILYDGQEYTPAYLQAENSFYEIVSSFSAVGVSINTPAVVNSIGRIIQTKQVLSSVSGAWDQYTHMAKWLVYLGGILEIKGTSIEGLYLSAVQSSMANMTNTFLYGYSWDAFACWNTGWNSVIASNRSMIKRHIFNNLMLWPPAMAVVNQ
ncbi:SIR2 family NAD-dependent protein deacylase [Pseudomonas pharyngis]|uniref:SIR2 family NAD-dependent protein deacylase n=1 Tax=Pseudomonas pharyngis TaxID=2892333 RepID=UPI001F46CD8C|nr:SIR2 family protein [Pseudomonas pharyngis]